MGKGADYLECRGIGHRPDWMLGRLAMSSYRVTASAEQDVVLYTAGAGGYVTTARACILLSSTLIHTTHNEQEVRKS